MMAEADEDGMVIARFGLSRQALRGETVIVTGAGGGIGYEAARALLWLGADAVIAEINERAGARAAERLAAEYVAEHVAFIRTDVGDEASVLNLYEECVRRFGKVDAVINNATIAVLGAVKDLPIEKWDASYRVNLRGPVLMAKTFLPGMIQRKHGVFACVSSTGTSYLGGYETFKAAQVHLANTLDAELEGTGVIAFTIGPGLVPTETATYAVGRLAPLMGMSVEEFFEMNRNAVLSVEEAGAGFALSILFAERFRGQEISSIQALKSAEIGDGHKAEDGGRGPSLGDASRSSALSASGSERARELCAAVRVTLKEQAEDWKHRSVFERQWVIRDFRKTAGMPVEEWLESLGRLEVCLRGEGAPYRPPLEKLAGYYEHLAELARGYERDAKKLEEGLRHVYAWKEEVEELEKLVTGGEAGDA
jgi:NAD(P)-dependent dehydrogenase (short-subunit alcohol dehydrogenase family)